MVAMLPLMANAQYVQLADGVYKDGTTLYIGSGVTSLGDLQVNPSEIYCYATIPPACMSNTFTSYDATLHVPASGMISYFTTLYWYNFNNIFSDAIEPLSVTMSNAEAELEIGQQLSLSATVAPGNATPNTVYWSTTDASVANVSGDGTVTAMTTGECDILAACVDKVVVCHVTVVNPRVTITLDTHEARLLPNHTLTLTATCSPIDVDLAVTSSNPGVAIPRFVNGTIMVVGVAEGTATITVNAADGWGNPDECVVTVYTELGDTNCDGYINIADVTELIDYLLNGDESQINLVNADTDKNGSVNIADVTELIDYLLTGMWSWERPITYTVNGVSFKMVPVEGGTFMMGASDDDVDAYDNEKPSHKVTLSSYSIGQTEVTQKLWVAIMGNNPSCYNGLPQRPVERVSWDDCQVFITKLNQLTGKTFRLPTEAEWEFAARGGNKSHGYIYAGSNTIDDVAWNENNSNNITHAVATKTPNELGLYDMSGNVWEWCQDRYGGYSSDAQTNPVGPITGYYRVDRGGSCGRLDNVTGCRVSFRDHVSPDGKGNLLGLRLALGPTPEEHEWVDLGLPSGTLWATCNVGANSPEEYGDYFAWGETESKEVYSWETYKWFSGPTNETITKYCTNVDNKTELDPEDDAAYANWGPKWRMPTLAQLLELIDNCTGIWTAMNGVDGYQITGPNGATVFLPAAGYCYNDGFLKNVGPIGSYSSRTLHSNGQYDAYGLYFDSGDWHSSYGFRGIGRSVRPVRASYTSTGRY